MCLLIIIRNPDPQFSLLVASNRDEDRSRESAPPGLFVGATHRILSPRDKRAGGTWLAVNQHGMLAGLTNISGAADKAGCASRGLLPHLALDEMDLQAAAEVVAKAVAKDRFNAFQLLLADASGAIAMRYLDGEMQQQASDAQVLTLTNEHRLNELELPQTQDALAEGLDATQRLLSLRPTLLQERGPGGHAALKRGKKYGTVSSSLLAVPKQGSEGLLWHYAHGSPDITAYRNYSNLARRLQA